MTELAYSSERTETVTKMVRAIYESFTNNAQAMAFLHGSQEASRINETTDKSIPLLDRIQLVIDARTGNPVTSALQNSDEFALGAMMTIIEGNRGNHDV